MNAKAADEQQQRPERASLKVKEGIVVSDKMDKTVVVKVARFVKHAEYGKYVQTTKKYHAHDEKNECGVGDTVRIVNSRPLSKKKHFRVQSIVSKAVKV